MYIRPFVSDIVRLGINIESVGSDCILLRTKDGTFITIHNKDGWTDSVSIEFPSRECICLSSNENEKIINFIKETLKL